MTEERNCQMNENELKQNIAKNITALRKLNDMTQAELAEKLSYSDKSISKWERGDGLPDVFVLTRIAEMFGVSVNDLITNDVATAEAVPKRDTTHSRRVLVTLLSTGLVWFIAALAFFFISVFVPDAGWSWIVFLYAVPVSAIVVVVFTHLWWGLILRCLSVSALAWGLTVSIHVTALVPNVQNMTLIYIATAVFQVLVILWYLYQYVRRSKWSCAAPEESATPPEPDDSGEKPQD